MKKFVKLFTPILGVSTVAAVAAPMSSCSSTCTITLTTDGNGELSQTTLSVAKGTSFAAAIKKLKITANDGYSFNGWVDKDGKKFNTRKEITSNFSAKATFAEAVAARELFWVNENSCYSIAKEAIAELSDVCIDFVSGETYTFKLTVNGNYLPYGLIVQRYEPVRAMIECFNRDDITVTLNNKDVTDECEFYARAIEVESLDLKDGDVMTFKFKFNWDENISAAPIVTPGSI